MEDQISKQVASYREIIADIESMTGEEFDVYCKEQGITRCLFGIDAKDEIPAVLKSEIALLEYLKEHGYENLEGEARDKVIEEYFRNSKTIYGLDAE